MKAGVYETCGRTFEPLMVSGPGRKQQQPQRFRSAGNKDELDSDPAWTEGRWSVFVPSNQRKEQDIPESVCVW